MHQMRTQMKVYYIWSETTIQIKNYTEKKKKKYW
jgi:hypothetical protein